MSPTHAEGSLITAAVRDVLTSQGRLKGERTVAAWLPTNLTDTDKADRTQYGPGYLVQFQQNAKGFKKGARLVVHEETSLPTKYASRFEVYRPVQMKLAIGDRVRVTAGGKTKDGKHRLSNGTLLTVQGFTKRGDMVVDHGWIIDRDFGHVTHGYVVTSHASQGTTVEKVIVAISSESVPATDQRTAYVAVTRGKEQALVFTDSRKELLRAFGRADQALSATELAEVSKINATNTPIKLPVIDRIRGMFAHWNDGLQHSSARQSVERELNNDR